MQRTCFSYFAVHWFWMCQTAATRKYCQMEPYIFEAFEFTFPKSTVCRLKAFKIVTMISMYLNDLNNIYNSARFRLHWASLGNFNTQTTFLSSKWLQYIDFIDKRRCVFSETLTQFFLQNFGWIFSIILSGSFWHWIVTYVYFLLW